MAIYDCFTFFNEIELLEWRLKLLNDVVDYFVIVESNITFQHKEKPFNLLTNYDKLEKYKKKIRYIKVNDYKNDDKNNDELDWSVEIYQRNAILRGLYDCKDDDIIFISDIDEFINPEIIRLLKKGICQYNIVSNINERRGRRALISQLKNYLLNPSILFNRYITKDILEKTAFVCEQDLYYFFVNYKSNKKWCGTTITLFKNLKKPQDLRLKRRVLPAIKNGGWHFSYLGGINRIKEKVNSTVDGVKNEMAGTVSKEKENKINNLVNNGIVYWTGEKMNILDINDINIKDIKWFIDKYPEMINFNK
ncbi:beta-1,4-N-acetylgalactosaminyltransferase [Megamonas funiformis]|uniref:beta-1,4-N-acetylgalactosaminyltransferase n=1 Tax=Megamonas funiformis TaxID=437897 RepID=UPI0022E1244F|nr:beta-1,4-N-acetylgalactosaminyltransferase [Megamonas funiformis]